MKGIFAVYKPVGPTSHDMIYRVRNATGVKKVGHAGTLDPQASGVLVVGVGREATKQLASIVQTEKEYVAEITLGQSSSTDDNEGTITSYAGVAIPTAEQIKSALEQFIGTTQQVPPIYSAIKVKGARAHRQTRRGRKVTLSARPIEIKEIEFLSYQWPVLKLRVVTGPGVYIRALARDLGEVLQTKGYLSALERTRVGQYTLNEAKILLK